MDWISVSEQMPEQTAKILITDGRSVSLTWYYPHSYKPFGTEDLGPAWGGQEVVAGELVLTPTHWAWCSSLLATLPQHETTE